MSDSPVQLNEQQKAAVRYTKGPLLVVAGAGSGKTRVIIEKIVYLVRQRGLPAARIAAITFTNKAAREMRERLAKRLGREQCADIAVSTFHSLGWKILRAHHEQLGYRPGISILDETDSQTVIRDLLPDGTPPDGVRLARAQVSRWKNRARESLTLSFARHRKRYGEKVGCDPSRFLDELPKELLEWRGEDSERDHAHSRQRATTHLDKLRELFAER